ncbi:MAG: glycosyltransferase family 4 protein [Phycicoccus sp.]
MSTVHVVVPAWVDDPRRPSGGNTYDRRLCDGLSARGWAVCERPVPGDWPRPRPASIAVVAALLRDVPDGGVVLLDGLIGSALPDILAAEAERLRLVVLVHLPLGLDAPSGEPRGSRPARHATRTTASATARTTASATARTTASATARTIASAAARTTASATARTTASATARTIASAAARTAESAALRAAEDAALRAAAAVVVTSRWTRDWLRTTYRLPDDRVSVIPPGAELADLAAPSPTGGRLLCVGAVTPFKGQDTLVEALATLADLDWSCTLVGSTDVDPGFTRDVVRRADTAGIATRLRLLGARTGPDLRAEYARADLLVVASRVETYGMVVTEALAHGVPVVAPEVGGVPEAVGHLRDGRRPGVLVPAGDIGALGTALRRWLTDERLRTNLRSAVHRRRPMLGSWSETAASVSRVLSEVAA